MFTRRLKRIFQNDGQTLIVAFDHGLTEGPAKGMEAPAEILMKLAASGADLRRGLQPCQRRVEQSSRPTASQYCS